MNDEPQEGQYPEEDFEIIEVDCATFLTEEQKSWPLTESNYPVEEFAIEEPLPILMLTPTASHESRQLNGFPKRDRIASLISAVSEYEVSLGGAGVYVSHPIASVSPNDVALVPREADGARDRLEQVARWVVGVGGFAAQANVA